MDRWRRSCLQVGQGARQAQGGGLEPGAAQREGEQEARPKHQALRPCWQRAAADRQHILHLTTKTWLS